MRLITKAMRSLASRFDVLGPTMFTWLADYLAKNGHITTPDHEEVEPDQLMEGYAWTVKAIAGEAWTVAQVIRFLRTARRCACPDKPQQARAGGPRWNKLHLKWFLAGYVPGVDSETQRNNMRKCADQTAAVCGLTFDEASSASTADIVLGVGSGRADQFDGPGGVLGWNYLPNGNDAPLQGKLDLAEPWTPRLHQQVVRHETFGHGCGLNHVNEPGNVMNPFLNASLDDWQAVDRRELVARYGQRVATPTPTPAPSDPVAAFVSTISIPGYRLVKVS